MARRLTAEQKAARLESHQAAKVEREARKRQSVGDVLQRLQRGNPTAPDGAVDHGVAAGRGWLVDRRATAKESTAEARRRVYERTRQQERLDREAHDRIDRMSAEERTELLEQLRRGVYPEWAPHLNTDHLNIDKE